MTIPRRRARSRFGSWGRAHPRLILGLKIGAGLAVFDLVTRAFGRLFPMAFDAVDRVWREVLPLVFLAGAVALLAALAVFLVRELSGRQGPKPGSSLSRGDRIFVAAVILLGGAGVCVLDAYFALADQRTEQASH